MRDIWLDRGGELFVNVPSEARKVRPKLDPVRVATKRRTARFKEAQRRGESKPV